MNTPANVVIHAFTEEQTERLTGVTRSQLRYWDRTQFFQPSFGYENRRVAFSRIYSFKDIAALRTISMLRNEYSVPLQHLRQVARKLQHLEDKLWTETTLYVLNKRVHFFNTSTGDIEDVLKGQYALELPLKKIQSEMSDEVHRLFRRSDENVGQVSRSRNLSHNAWVVAGTRVPVATIKRFAEDGFSIDEIQHEYPSLTKADIRAAIEYEGDGAAA